MIERSNLARLWESIDEEKKSEAFSRRVSFYRFRLLICINIQRYLSLWSISLSSSSLSSSPVLLELTTLVLISHLHLFSFIQKEIK
jgi:hypothetical protein